MAHEGLSIRSEVPGDREAVYRVNAAAFDRTNEARLVDALRDDFTFILSLVAELDGQITGHALFTAVQLGASDPAWSGAALGPIAVLPEVQGRGIGGALIQEGLARLKAKAYPVCVLLGHPGYYPRFGFRPASIYGLRCKWPVPDEVFMALELAPGALDGVSGLVTYAAAFDEAT